MNKKFKINYLSSDFFQEYKSSDYPEIESKEKRPYMVLLINVCNNTFAIPFRTNVKHKSCYQFKNSSRNTDSSTGLDYSKAVIVNDKKYIGNQAFIDRKEYLELNSKYYFIIKQFTKYINGYKRYINGELNEFESRKYKFSTLQYFHNELGIHKGKCATISVSAPVNDAPLDTAVLTRDLPKPNIQSNRRR